MSQVRQNYHQDCEAAINKQVNLELYACYVYQSMASYFNRENVAFPGAHKFFKKASDEEREHAEKLMKYQNKRGGTVVLQDIQKPERDSWGTLLEALEAALQLEKNVNQALLDVHKLADKHVDPHLTNYIEDEFLGEQVDTIKDLADKITRLKRCGPGLGEYMFDDEEFS